MLPVYPMTLPLPTMDGYTIAAAPRFVRTGLSSGPAAQRARRNAPPLLLEYRWVLSLEQLETFEYWYAQRLRKGQSWFSGPLSLGTGCTTGDLRFTGAYSAAQLSGDDVWEVTASMELRERPLITGDQYTAMIQVVPFTESEALFHQIMNTDLPQSFGV